MKTNLVLLAGLICAGPAPGQIVRPPKNPDAIVDLMTFAGVESLKAQWRYRDARIIGVEHRSAGPDGKPSGEPNRTHDITPHAGELDFDDREWEIIEPASLQARRSTGRLCFGWYRIQVTIPDRIADFETTGSTAVFEIVVDDYAEIWVDGRQPQVIGQVGGALAAGWNAPNRVVIGRNLKPGQKIQLAVFAANGPLSDPPGNYLWIRSATIDFHRPENLTRAVRVTCTLDRRDSGLDDVVPPGAVLERLADGFAFTEGPVWVPARHGGAGGKPIDEGYLLFSDPNRNTIYRLDQDGQVSVFRTKSGYTGADIARYQQPGSNGLALDAQGRLTLCEHGNRRVTRIEHNGVLSVLADRFEGKRLNSPNDLVYRSDGALYFSDPPFGLPGFHDDPQRELVDTGVFCLIDGVLKRVSVELRGPNGLAFSPDEKYLYVTNWDPEKKVVLRYPVRSDGGLDPGEVFFDMTSAPGEEALDGIEVDHSGHLFVSGPGGVWVLSPDARHLGTILMPELPANFAWGDEDGRSLYMTARTSIYRMRLARTQPAGALAEVRAPFIERVNPRLDDLLRTDARIETIADGFTWLEGPVWDRQEQCLYFSDIPQNTVYRWTRTKGAEPFLSPSGYTGAAPFPGREPGSNGLALDSQGRLILCEHGDRRVTRLERDRSRTVLAAQFGARRLNSPNDCTVRPSGDIYFTDPPFGLPGVFSDAQKELPFSGVYRWRPSGEVELITQDMRAPNGIAFSPSGDVMYVSNADRDKPVWMAFSISEDGRAGPGRVFASAAWWVSKYPGDPDGMKTDLNGNLFAAGPGGVYVFSPDGAHLGTIVTSVATSNCAWGDDGSALYVTAGEKIWRVETLTRGF